MIKQGLNIRLGQSMSMTPQLQQAIRLLQLSSVELQQEIQEILETNPLLETMSGEEDPSEKNQSEPDKSGESDSNESNEFDSADSIPEDLNMDADWDDIYDPAWKTTASTEKSTSDLIEAMHSDVQGLHEHLEWQIQMSNLSVQDKEIARLIIDYIDDNGFLTESVEQIHATLSQTLLVDLDEVEVVLHFIQNMGPPGIAARNIGECLLLQIRQLHQDHPQYKKAIRLLEKNLDLLEKRDYTKIKRVLKLTNSALEQILALFRTLDPKPGKEFASDQTEYIVPDIYVRKINVNGQGKWKVSLNSQTQPALQINDYYADMLSKTKEKNQTSDYIRENLQQARWFIKSLENRNSTIVNVALAIIERQAAFFQYGPEAMKPMVLKDLADQLGLHESTISRVTTRKYMHTPRGVFEFKYFFSSHVGTQSGGECSATAIRAMIKKLIAEEDPGKPLSDNKLTNLLKQQGINVARRTVAKYREALMIPSSHERKAFVS